MNVPRERRLDEFLNRLEAAQPAATADEALALISDILTAVEDELTGIPNNPPAWETDGRMYPPQPDSARSYNEADTVTRYRNKGHNTLIGINGSICIKNLSDDTLIDKCGIDGIRIHQL